MPTRDSKSRAKFTPRPKSATSGRSSGGRANGGSRGETYERNKQIERVVEAIDKLAGGPVVPSVLAEHLQISERTLTRFMGALGRAGLPIYTRRIRYDSPRRYETQWVLDHDAYIKHLTRKRDHGGGTPTS